MGLRKNQRPVTDADYEQVRKLHGQNLGRNEIARRMQRSPRTISVIAEELGLTFDRTMTAAATEARKIDAKARRAALIDRAYGRAERVFDRLEADQYKFTSTTVNGIETEVLDHVPAHEEKALAGAITQYLNQAAKLEALDSDDGVEAAKGMVGQLLTGLSAVYREQQQSEGDGDAP
ncbi:helix-turn-helix domain-containing protein [Streptomyces macrosporus]|uniref:Helix-turn-helix domain-containing protein n=1 Tax=Streptomyces macrosporus TaxID=44032 RepID=A0ABN3KEB2_9ACTN